VAAIDHNKTVAEFSQKNNAVELAAPGVAVLSTVSFKENNTLTVDDVIYKGNYIKNAARTTGVSAALVDGGLCAPQNK
jgi:serine protease